MKNFPYLSLSLLSIAYCTFSWFLIHATATWLAWASVLAFTILQALLLTTLFEGLRLFLSRWLRSDIGYFSLIILTALSVITALVWFKTFGYFLVLISAEILARLDLQNAGFSRLQAFFVLTLFSLFGLAIGWVISLNPLFRLAEPA